MKHLLITGFDPFGGGTVNPAWEAVSRLPDALGGFRLTKLQFAVEFDVEDTLHRKGNLLVGCQIHLGREFDRHIVAVGLPEGREEGAALGAAVVHLVAEPNLVVARIPDPGCLIRSRRHSVRV